MSSCLTNTLRLGTRRILAQNQACLIHTTPPAALVKNTDGNFNVTMVPGDGVGPELMDIFRPPHLFLLLSHACPIGAHPAYPLLSRLSDIKA